MAHGYGRTNADPGCPDPGCDVSCSRSFVTSLTPAPVGRIERAIPAEFMLH